MDVLPVLASPRRREILRLVWAAERRAGDIHRAMPEVTFGAVSQHLRVLGQAGLIAARQEGRCRYYSARKQELGPLRDWLESMWSDALFRLRIRAEMEDARRGPRPASRRRRAKR
jgi:DNA-binding transcriptional ArsR family regulator